MKKGIKNPKTLPVNWLMKGYEKWSSKNRRPMDRQAMSDYLDKTFRGASAGYVITELYFQMYNYIKHRKLIELTQQILNKVQNKRIGQLENPKKRRGRA